VLSVLAVTLVFLGGCNGGEGVVNSQVFLKSTLSLEDHDRGKPLSGFYTIRLCDTKNPASINPITAGVGEVVYTGLNQSCVLYGWSDGYYVSKTFVSNRLSDDMSFDMKPLKMGGLGFVYSLEKAEGISGLSQTFDNYLLEINITSTNGYFKRANVCVDWTAGILSVDNLAGEKFCPFAGGWKELPGSGGLFNCDNLDSVYDKISRCNSLKSDNHTCVLGGVGKPVRFRDYMDCKLLDNTLDDNVTESFDFLISVFYLDERDRVSFCFFDAYRDYRFQDGGSYEWDLFVESPDGLDVGNRDYCFTIELLDVVGGL